MVAACFITKPTFHLSGYNRLMYLFFVIPILLGGISSWMVNYLADVLPIAFVLSNPFCQACQTRFAWFDYMLLRPCKNCGKRRSLRTYAVHVIMIIGSISIWIFPGQMLPFPLAFILLVYLAVILVIDMEHRLILRQFSIIGTVLGLGIGIFLRGSQSIIYGIISTLLGGVIGFGIMLLIYFAGQIFIKYISKKHGLSTDEMALGFGDVTLSGILGLMLGWQNILPFLLLSILAGGIVSLYIFLKMLIVKRYNAFSSIPYAPFLILSALYFLFLQYVSSLYILQ
jgi:prepilin signal peptidase PulO-like enzyme (type II secretory pathway)